MTHSAPLPCAGDGDREAVVKAIAACRAAAGPSRALDALIARAVFPGLADLVELEPGIWRDRYARKVRALRYSSHYPAATTLVPTGSWIERRAHDLVVVGSHDDAFGVHSNDIFALCIAALGARLAEADRATASIIQKSRP